MRVRQSPPAPRSRGPNPNDCERIRDPVADHLLTPQNSALIVIHYQPRQVHSINSMDRDLLIATRSVTRRLDMLRERWLRRSAHGQDPTISSSEAADGWALESAARRSVIMAALWTEICLAFPSLDAMREGYAVYPVVDAVGGTSVEAHRAGLGRILQAGAQPIGWVSLAGELQRDWARTDTASDFEDIVFTSRLLKGE